MGPVKEQAIKAFNHPTLTRRRLTYSSECSVVCGLGSQSIFKVGS